MSAGTAVSTVKNVVESQGGRVVAQMRDAGLYWVQVQSGGEGWDCSAHGELVEPWGVQYLWCHSERSEESGAVAGIGRVKEVIRRALPAGLSQYRLLRAQPSVTLANSFSAIGIGNECRGDFRPHGERQHMIQSLPEWGLAMAWLTDCG